MEKKYCYWTQFHSVGGAAEMSPGRNETRAIDQSAAGRKYAALTQKTPKQSQMWLRKIAF